MTALYDLAGQYKTLCEKLESLNFEESTVADTIEASGLVDDIANKAQGCELVARQIEVFNPAIDTEIERLTTLKKQREHKAKMLREYVKAQMQVAGIEKIECPIFSISIAKNPPAVEVYEQGLIPAEYMKQPEAPPPEPAPDKKAIAAALKAGKDVQGARLTQSTRLKIN